MSQVKGNNGRVILLIIIFIIAAVYIALLQSVDNNIPEEVRKINPIKNEYNSTIDSLANDFKWVYIKLSDNNEFMIQIKSFKLDLDDFDIGDKLIKKAKSNQFTLIKLSGDTIRFKIYDDY